MSTTKFEQIEPILEKKLGEVLLEITMSMEISELKKLDWFCSNADYYIALDTKKVA